MKKQWKTRTQGTKKQIGSRFQLGQSIPRGMQRSQRIAEIVGLTKEELQGVELALHFVDKHRGGINKSVEELEPHIISAHEKVIKKLDKIKGWR